MHHLAEDAFALIGLRLFQLHAAAHHLSPVIVGQAHGFLVALALVQLPQILRSHSHGADCVVHHARRREEIVHELLVAFFGDLHLVHLAHEKGAPLFPALCFQFSARHVRQRLHHVFPAAVLQKVRGDRRKLRHLVEHGGQISGYLAVSEHPQHIVSDVQHPPAACVFHAAVGQALLSRQNVGRVLQPCGELAVLCQLPGLSVIVLYVPLDKLGDLPVAHARHISQIVLLGEFRLVLRLGRQHGLCLLDALPDPFSRVLRPEIVHGPAQSHDIVHVIDYIPHVVRVLLEAFGDIVFRFFSRPSLKMRVVPHVGLEVCRHSRNTGREIAHAALHPHGLHDLSQPVRGRCRLHVRRVALNKTDLLIPVGHEHLVDGRVHIRVFLLVRFGRRLDDRRVHGFVRFDLAAVLHGGLVSVQRFLCGFVQLRQRRGGHSVFVDPPEEFCVPALLLRLCAAECTVQHPVYPLRFLVVPRLRHHFHQVPEIGDIPVQVFPVHSGGLAVFLLKGQPFQHLHGVCFLVLVQLPQLPLAVSELPHVLALPVLPQLCGRVVLNDGPPVVFVELRSFLLPENAAQHPIRRPLVHENFGYLPKLPRVVLFAVFEHLPCVLVQLEVDLSPPVAERVHRHPIHIAVGVRDCLYLVPAHAGRNVLLRVEPPGHVPGEYPCFLVCVGFFQHPPQILLRVPGYSGHILLRPHAAVVRKAARDVRHAYFFQCLRQCDFFLLLRRRDFFLLLRHRPLLLSSLRQSVELPGELLRAHAGRRRYDLTVAEPDSAFDHGRLPRGLRRSLFPALHPALFLCYALSRSHLLGFSCISFAFLCCGFFFCIFVSRFVRRIFSPAVVFVPSLRLSLFQIVGDLRNDPLPAVCPEHFHLAVGAIYARKISLSLFFLLYGHADSVPALSDTHILRPVQNLLQCVRLLFRVPLQQSVNASLADPRRYFSRLCGAVHDLLRHLAAVPVQLLSRDGLPRRTKLRRPPDLIRRRRRHFHHQSADITLVCLVQSFLLCGRFLRGRFLRGRFLFGSLHFLRYFFRSFKAECLAVYLSQRLRDLRSFFCVATLQRPEDPLKFSQLFSVGKNLIRPPAVIPLPRLLCRRRFFLRLRHVPLRLFLLGYGLNDPGIVPRQRPVPQSIHGKLRRAFVPESSYCVQLVYNLLPGSAG